MAASVLDAQVVNGIATPAEEDAFYNQLLRLCDTVVQGKHPQLKLSPAAIEQLRQSLTALSAPASASATQTATGSRTANGCAFSANGATNNAQQSSASVGPTCAGLPGLSASQSSPFVPSAMHAKTTPGGLDPIFLEKSDSLVRAEGQLKRQRIERELHSQGEQRQPLTKERDLGSDAQLLNIDAILASSAAREMHISGLKPVRAGSASSFDTNDYYSSQVESAWSSPESGKKADVESVGMNSAQSSFAQTSVSGMQPTVAHGTQGSKTAVHTYASQLQDAYTIEDDDDEYTPPDVTAFGDFGVDAGSEEGQIDEDEDDDEYEPGEVAQESIAPFPPAYQPIRPPVHTSPKVPVIRNHLTHIAAPQPNRVSPLAVAKGPNLELELVNGRPEIVQQKGRQHHQGSNNAGPSRASTASPANGAGGSNKKRRKKRKRDNEQQQSAGRAKKKRDRQPQPTSPTYNDFRIKDEPVSPPPSFATIPEAQQYAQPAYQTRPAEIDLVSPRHVQYVSEPLRSSGLRYEYAQPSSPAVVRVASPAAHRPVHRDSQDLRRVASMHLAQRPPSPGQRTYSPAVSMTYGPHSAELRYQEPIQYVREPSPPRYQEYHDPYGPRAQSPALMAPPVPSAPQRIVVDQYGRQYYAADPQPAPAPAAVPRASLAPVSNRAPTEIGHERAASRVAASYGQSAPVATSYEQPDHGMGPPPRRPDEHNVRYVDARGYPLSDYSSRPVEHVRYSEAPTSPLYQHQLTAPRYNMAPPPVPAAGEPTSPAYNPTRSHSVRPEDSMPAPSAYVRQSTVAPQPYVRQEVAQAPLARAMSVMPGYEQPHAQSFAPQAQVQYVDQYGRPVYPNEVRQVTGGQYRYQ